MGLSSRIFLLSADFAESAFVSRANVVAEVVRGFTIAHDAMHIAMLDIKADRALDGMRPAKSH